MLVVTIEEAADEGEGCGADLDITLRVVGSLVDCCGARSREAAYLLQHTQQFTVWNS
jgi:hypothetical protein